MKKTYDLQEEFEDRTLRDGIYVVSERTVVKELKSEALHSLNVADEKILRAFVKEYPRAVIASAYETYTIFLLSQRPEKFTGVERGHGFNYGATMLLGDLPARHSLLILAEVDVARAL